MKKEARMRKVFEDAMSRVPWGTKLNEQEIAVVRDAVLKVVGRAFDVLRPGKTYRRAIGDLLRVLRIEPEVRREYVALFRKAERKQKAKQLAITKAISRRLYKIPATLT